MNSKQRRKLRRKYKYVVNCSHSLSNDDGNIYEIIHDMNDWCNREIGLKNYQHHLFYTFFFVKEEDMVSFKLRWL